MVPEDRRDPSVLTLDTTLPNATSLEETLPAASAPAVKATVATRDSVPRGMAKTLPPIDRTRYAVEGEVGRGGLGRVLRARDTALGRPVAIKELLVAGEAAQRRFVREALITARLQHPAIVPIYDAGEGTEREPFYAMRLVSGRSLGDVLAGTRTLEERLALLPSLITVADAMAYAHGQKIIHRDLKPHNVLVGAFGEIVVIDWGLAKDLAAAEDEAGESARTTASSLETLDGAVMGTPAYMSPEQANGDEVDERADVYALGAILYHLIAGSAPHTGGSLDEMLVKISEGDVVPLSEREPDVPADLAAIVGKAMASDKTQRYRTARELAEDLHRFQTGQLVGAHRYTRAERVRRWVRRYRGIALTAAIAGAILVAYGAWSVRKIVAERQAAEHEAQVARTAQHEADLRRDEAVTQAMLVRAREYAASGHSAEEVAVLRALARPDAAETARRLAVREGGLVWKAHQRLAMALGRDTGFVFRSADGARFVAQEPLAIVGWEAATGKELARVSLPAGGQVIAVSPTARFVAVLSCKRRGGDGCGGLVLADTLLIQPDATVELRELVGARTLASWEGGEKLSGRALAFAVDDSAVVVRAGAQLRVLDASGGPLRELDPGAACAGSLAVAPGGSAVAVACTNHILLSRAGDAKPVTLAVKPSPQSELYFTAPDRLLVVGDRVQLWDVPRGELRGEGPWPDGDSPSVVHGERRDLEWEVIEHPGARGDVAERRLVLPPQLVLGSTRPHVDRTSLLAPAARMYPGGAFVTTEDDWRAIAIQHDQVHIAMLDEMLPAPPADHCLGRVGGEARATTVLDGGARLLVDEQELPAGIFTAPQEGYRHTTSVELPVRQLRPLVAAEDNICLVWGGAVGASTVDGGDIPSGATAADDGAGGLVVLAGPSTAFHIARSGARSPITVGTEATISAAGSHVASLDLAASTLLVSDVASGKVVRTVPLPEKHKTVRGLSWAARDVAQLDTDASTLLIPIDPALPVRAREHALVTDEHSPYATQLAGSEVAVVRVRDGATVGRHSAAGASVRILPDATGRVLVRRDANAAVIALDNASMPLTPPPARVPGDLEVIGNHLLARAGNEVEIWDLTTGKGRKLSGDVAISSDEIWTLNGHREPHLDRSARSMRGTDVELATAGLPFHRIRGELQASPDGKRLTATYEVTEERSALATWDATTGDLLWVGPPTARVIGNWVVAGGRAFVPRFDLPSILADTGARTNLRVCKSDLRAVAIVPPPPPDSYWAPDSACAH